MELDQFSINEMELNIENCSSNFVLGGVYVRGMVIPSQGTFLDKRKQCYDFKILLHYIITMSLELVNHWAFLFPFFLRFAFCVSPCLIMMSYIIFKSTQPTRSRVGQANHARAWLRESDWFGRRGPRTWI